MHIVYSVGSRNEVSICMVDKYQGHFVNALTTFSFPLKLSVYTESKYGQVMTSGINQMHPGKLRSQSQIQGGWYLNELQIMFKTLVMIFDLELDVLYNIKLKTS